MRRACVTCAVLLVVCAWASATTITAALPGDFSGVQGQGGWHYGAVAFPNIDATNWAANWADYPYYNSDEGFWWRAEEGGIWKRVFADRLWSNHTDCPGVMWVADQDYATLDVTGGVTSGTWWSFFYYEDASTGLSTALTQGVTNTLTNVQAGSKIAFFMGAGNGNGTQVDHYALSIVGTPVPEPVTLGLLAMGGVAMLRRHMA